MQKRLEFDRSLVQRHVFFHYYRLADVSRLDFLYFHQIETEISQFVLIYCAVSFSELSTAFDDQNRRFNDLDWYRMPCVEPGGILASFCHETC